MKSIKRDNTSIAYTSTGSGEITLLFVHGSYIDQSYWSKQVEYFKDSFKVVTIDLPGHGKSGRERQHWSIVGFADDVLAVIDRLGLQQVILVGHSMGAEISLIVASKSEKVIGFVSIDYFKNAATALPAEIVQNTLENLKKDFEGTNEYYVRTGLLTEKTSNEIADRVVQDYRNAYKPMGLAIMPDMFNAYTLEQALLPRLKVTLHLINVDYFPLNEAPLKEHVVNGYDVVTIHGTCHFPMLENPDALNDALDQQIHKIRESLTPVVV
ncbi:MAG TPA: alpha/beta hydrolase [Chryseolinea sp.]|nr:alpha/beta hydrolase [Chryseolinea sp.]